MIPPSAQPPRTQTPPLGQVNTKVTVYCWAYLMHVNLTPVLIWERMEKSSVAQSKIYIEMYIKIQTHLNLPLYVLRVLKCDINAAR